MLEVVNLSKIYKTKGGADVKALDEVSVRFPEKGMVFLLGKSGSGKSTLLNVCGGLDAPTSGEIIVKGRSSKAFSQSDFDSYRNTFVGFIFQEYNILNEFSVEDNIALALELQGKSKDKAAIAALLEQVDLTGYAKRKPNTLSGGQKQRIAIARALVKAPEIIMADEPTGALDSATGKQVFDTLKKLSKDKLVLVVSHDRDFAEQYGDRVIELKDGKIISDVTKTQEKQQSLTGNVTAVGDTLCVKNASTLSDKDFEEIKNFLRGANGDVMIAGGEKDVKAFKAVSRITDDGQKEVFRDTNEAAIAKKAYTPADSKFIRSKLPMRHAMKIGISSVKSKPVRLFFTVLLCTVAFVLFGLFSTMMFYNGDETFKMTLQDSPYTTVRLEKYSRSTITNYRNGKEDYSYTNQYNARFNDEDLNAYAQQFGSNTFGGVSVWQNIAVQNSSRYWENRIRFFAYLPANAEMQSSIIGDYPTAEDEICISSYLADVLYNCKIIGKDGTAIDLNNAEDVIGKYINVDGTAYKITGIFESGDIPEKFNPIKEDGEYGYSLESSYENELQDNLHLVVFVTQPKLKKISDNYNSNSYKNEFRRLSFVVSKNEKGEWVVEDGYGNGVYKTLAELPSNDSVHWFTANKTALTQNEVLVSKETFYNVVAEKFYQEINAAINNRDTLYNQYYEFRQQYLNNLANPDDYASVEALFSQWWEAYYGNIEVAFPEEGDANWAHYAAWKEYALPYFEIAKKCEELDNFNNTVLNPLREGGMWVWQEEGEKGEGEKNEGMHVFVALTDDQRTELQNKLFAWINERNLELKIAAKLYNSNDGKNVGEVRVFTVVGAVGLNKTQISYGESALYLSDETSTALWEEQRVALDWYEEYSSKYQASPNDVYTNIFLPYNHSDEQTNTFLSIYQATNVWSENDTKISISNSMIQTVEMVDSTIDSMSKVFLWIGIVLAVFAALLLSNFISVSINHKKREIGILRAVGARGFDVFKIFFSESFFITIICVVISIIGTIVLCHILNAEMAAGLGASIFSFGILSLLVLLGVAFLTAVLATFLPVWNAARKKPVDSIRAL